MRTITATFGGICSLCGGSFPVGAAIQWKPGRSEHIECPADGPTAGATVVFSVGSHDKPPIMEGRPLRAPQRAGGGVVLVLRQVCRYSREGGLSFGVGEDPGWLTTYWCRKATAKEATPLLEDERRELAEVANESARAKSLSR